jgi:TRAP transporter TAXI family solute receptor
MASRILGTSIKLPLLTLSLWLALQHAFAQQARLDTDPNWVGVIAGDESGSELALGIEMAELFAHDANLQVVATPGDAGLGNIARLMSEPHADIAFVSTDALALAEDESPASNLAEELQLVARLSPQEVHVLARREVGSLAELAGKTVGVGRTGGSSAVTAELLFGALGIEISPIALDCATALQQVEEGTIDAIVVVGGKPVPLLRAVSADQGLHLLPIEFGESLAELYLPTRLRHDDYPDLISAEDEVSSVATGLAMLAAKAKDDPGHAARVARVVTAFFSRFAELKEQGHHPKWREVNLAATLPGLNRVPEAEAWVKQHRAEEQEKRPVKPNIEAGAVSSSSQTQRNTLFQQFIEWKRAKGH